MTQRLLEDRHDVVTRKLLLASGMTRGEIDHARATKRLHDAHSGVYVRGRRELDRDGRLWAAIAACHPGSLEGGLAAGVRYGMLEPQAYALSLTTTSGARPHGVDVHRVSVQPPGLILDGVPVLTPLLADGPRRTRSPVEDEVLPLIAASGLPVPERNVRLLGWSVDFLWRREKVVLEVDSWTYHATASHYERDARKDADLSLAGFSVVRATRAQVKREPSKLIARLAGKLPSSS